MFRRRWRDGNIRVHQCTPCHYAREKLRRREKRLKRVVTYARNVARAQRNRNIIIRLTLQISHQFNGTEEVARAFKAAYDQSVTLGRPFTASRILQAVIDLAIIGEKEQADQIREMTDEQLEEAHFQSTVDLVRSHPEIVVWVATKCGWKVEPPADLASAALEKTQSADPV